MDASRIKEALRLSSVEIYEDVSSTQDVARKCPAQPPFLVASMIQSRGKGRLGRKWESPRGGLYFTLVIEPLPEIWFVPLVSAYAVWKVMSSKARDIRLKWPNDLYASGKKMAGIIVENWGNRLGIGVGINVMQKTFHDELAGRAVSLTMLTGEEHNLEDLLRDTASAINKDMEELREFGFAHFHFKVREVLLKSNQPVKFTQDGIEHTGNLLDLGVSGEALVRDSLGKHHTLPAQHLLEVL